MAEYIDRNKLNKKKKYLFQTKGMPFPKSEYFIKADDFYSIPTADVIERTEYEKLRLVNLDLAETNKGLLAEHEQLEKLRSKIDKAIEEIESKKYIIDIDRALEILKRNIGE